MLAPELPNLFLLRRLAMPTDPVLDPASPATKSGWKTTEAYLTLIVTILGAVMASGLLDPHDPTQATIVKVIGLILSVASVMGYQAGRSYVKATAIQGAAMVAAAGAAAANPSQPAPPSN